MSYPLLKELNTKHIAVHSNFEDLFWVSKMGDHSRDDEFVKAETALNEFRINSDLSRRVNAALVGAEGDLRKKLLQWQNYFSCYQVPPEFLPIRTRAAVLEAAVCDARANREEGFIHPKTGAFVKASSGKMKTMMGTHDDEGVRKACWEAIEKLAVLNASEYVELVNLRNEYARALGDEDFYAYKLRVQEGMTKNELFALFDGIYERTKYGFDNVREMEKSRPGLRKPWNFGYMLAGDLTKKKDPYLQFSEALIRWGRSFAALGIRYQGATLQLDLLDRKGKYNNGFCHWPRLVHFEDGKRISGACNFTANSVPGQVGAGSNGIHTLFHEGGHAAHLTNVETTETCVNHEYAPMSVSWAETHSMFFDTMQSSIEWMTRYAKNAEGEAYPFALYEEAVRRLNPIQPLDFMHILRIVNFEREVYTTPNLTAGKILEIAKRTYRKHFDRDEDSYALLDVPHIYAWESSAYYHGYGLAMLTLEQWREYFYEKYGYIVDNPEVAREMHEVWKLGSSKTFKEFVDLATSKSLSAEPYLKTITSTVDETLQIAHERIARLTSVREHTGPIDLNARIRLVDGKNLVADNSQGFEYMADTYREWVLSKEKEALNQQEPKVA